MDQKQIHLILEAVEPILQVLNFKVMIMIAGMASPNDPYGVDCQKSIEILRKKYPHNFWADPTFFFSEHRIDLFHGTDFAVMFSKFEPGAMVLLEYLSGGTPVLATRTGGLVDVVQEINVAEQTGNGLFIEGNKPDFLVRACLQA